MQSATVSVSKMTNYSDEEINHLCLNLTRRKDFSLIKQRPESKQDRKIWCMLFVSVGWTDVIAGLAAKVHKMLLHCRHQHQATLQQSLHL